MERLILLRHGEAEESAASGEDFDRALTDEGRAEAAAAGRLLTVSGSSPDLALVSSAVRAVQTFEAARPVFLHARQQASRSLYLATARELMEAIRAEQDHVRVLMVVGHNPGIHELALALAREGGPSLDLAVLETRFPTGAAAVFTFDGRGKPQLANLHLPKHLGRKS
jgi:phosphohistidine phosphatase